MGNRDDVHQLCFGIFYCCWFSPHYEIWEEKNVERDHKFLRVELFLFLVIEKVDLDGRKRKLS
jgi:hypothetical protein